MMAHGDAKMRRGVAKKSVGCPENRSGVRKTGRGVAFGRCNETLGLTPKLRAFAGRSTGSAAMLVARMP
jgi:hypothetical protein